MLPPQQTGNKHPSCGDPMVKSVSQLLLGASAPDNYSQTKIVVFGRSNLVSGWTILNNYTQEIISFLVGVVCD